MGSRRNLFPKLLPHLPRFCQIARKILHLSRRDGRLSPLQPFSAGVNGPRALIQEKVMKRILNKARISALLCGAVMIATPAFAQLGGAVGGTVSGATGGIGGT